MKKTTMKTMNRLSLAILCYMLLHSSCILPVVQAKQFQNRFNNDAYSNAKKKSMKDRHYVYDKKKPRSMKSMMSMKMSKKPSSKKKSTKKKARVSRFRSRDKPNDAKVEKKEQKFQSPSLGNNNKPLQSPLKKNPTANADDPNTDEMQSPMCFQDAKAATKLGTLVLDALWDEIQATDCKPSQINRVLDSYFRSDLIVQDSTDAVILGSLDEYKVRMVGTVAQPGRLVKACHTQDVRYTPTELATVEPGVFDDFAWTGNRVVKSKSKRYAGGLQKFAQQREIYLIEMIGAAGSFLYAGGGGKSLKNRFFYSHHGGKGKKSNKNNQPPHCHRPQIYGIVLLD